MAITRSRIDCDVCLDALDGSFNSQMCTAIFSQEWHKVVGVKWP